LLFFLYIFVPIQFFPCYIHSIALKPIDFFFGFFGCNIFYYIFAVVSTEISFTSNTYNLKIFCSLSDMGWHWKVWQVRWSDLFFAYTFHTCAWNKKSINSGETKPVYLLNLSKVFRQLVTS